MGTTSFASRSNSAIPILTSPAAVPQTLIISIPPEDPFFHPEKNAILQARAEVELNMPCLVALNFEGFQGDPRKPWNVWSARHTVGDVLLHWPEILTHLTPESFDLARRCMSQYHGSGSRSDIPTKSALGPIWVCTADGQKREWELALNKAGVSDYQATTAIQ